MGRKLGGTKKILFQLLLEYLKDSDRSDSKVAKELGVSQATVSRLKGKLLKEGYISHFSVIPNFAKIGYEILAFSFVKFNMDQVTEIEDRSEDWAMSHPEIVFTARADGLGADAITISLHKDYAAYKDFFAENRNLFGKMMADVSFILVDLKGPIAKPFSFGHRKKSSPNRIRIHQNRNKNSNRISATTTTKKENGSSTCLNHRLFS